MGCKGEEGERGGEVEVRESEALRVFEEEVMSQAQNGVEDGTAATAAEAV